MKTWFKNACTGFGLALLLSAPFALGMGSAPERGSTGAEGFQPGDLIGSLKNTYYYVTQEEDFTCAKKTASIRTTSGALIAKVCPRFKSRTDIEGSGRLSDGRVINFADYEGGEYFYSVTSNPWGDGYRRCPLQPFHTIAVNRDQVPLGSIVRIEETLGMLLPDGTRHNGLWRAQDTGSAITWGRVDLFIGLEKYEKDPTMRTLSRHGILHMKSLTVRMVSLPGTTDCRVSPGTFTPPTPQTLSSLFYAPNSMSQL